MSVRSSSLLLVAAAILAMAVTIPPAKATLRCVPETYPTIQAAISAAVSGDTVLVNTGVYAEVVDFLDKELTVTSYFLLTGDSTAIAQTQIQSGSPGYPVVTIAGGQTRASHLCGFTIGPASPPYGSGVRCWGTSPTIEWNVITNCCVDESGGGIFVSDGSPRIWHNRITGNWTESVASQFGGAGIFVWNGSPDIRNNEIDNNTAGGEGDFGDGGGICALYGAPTIRQNRIYSNLAQYRGGGIFCEDSEPVITDNEIFGNIVNNYYGGGIASRNCASVIERNRIHDNVGGAYGGGLFY